METVIKVSISELTDGFLDKIRSFIGSEEGYEIEVHLKNANSVFYQKLDASIQQAAEGKVIRFTPDELDAYTKLNTR